MNRETTDQRMVYLYGRYTESGQDTQGAFRKLTSIRYVTVTRYLESIAEVQMYRSSVLNMQYHKMIRHVTSR